MASPIESVSVLADAYRRHMFAFIRRARRPVTRDEAAASAGISRKLAAFHLEKLVDAGLLRVAAAPAGGERRIGRRPKLYEPTGTPVQVSVPERRHGLLAGLLLDAVQEQRAGESGRDAAVRAASARGTELGAAQRERDRPGRLGAERALSLCERMLEEHGFEPARESGSVRQRNCPFEPLAGRAREVVCGLNHAYVSGWLEGMRITSVAATLDPVPGECCVRLGPGAV